MKLNIYKSSGERRPCGVFGRFQAESAEQMWIEELSYEYEEKTCRHIFYDEFIWIWLNLYYLI